MSEILVDNLTGKTSAGSITVYGEGGTETQSLQQGLAKAWINFDGASTGAVGDYDRGSLNCAVIIDNGTGDYRIGFTNDMANVNYSVSVNGRNSTTVRTVYNCGGPSQTEPTPSNFEVAAFNESGGAYINASHMFASVHGDLA